VEIQGRPAHYSGPNLDPHDVRLSPRFLGRGVYALMASKVPRDNSGVVIGSRGALVIDAGMNGAMARQIQERVRRLTDKPLLYVVNTNYHGDHTFGNYAFPGSVEIVAHRKTYDSMSDLEAEKRIRARNLFGNDAAIADVTTWRKPDRVFDGEFLELDLGDRKVQLWHFGPGNTPGDTIVYVPEVKAAWTGISSPMNWSATRCSLRAGRASTWIHWRNVRANWLSGVSFPAMGRWVSPRPSIS